MIVVPFDRRTQAPRGPEPQFVQLAQQEAKLQQRVQNTKHYDRPITQDMMLRMQGPQDQPKV